MENTLKLGSITPVKHKIKHMTELKYPIGLKPKKIHEDHIKMERFLEICSAISRYYYARLKIPLEWIEEYNELVDFTKEKFDTDLTPKQPLTLEMIGEAYKVIVDGLVWQNKYGVSDCKVKDLIFNELSTYTYYYGTGSESKTLYINTHK